MGIGFRHTLFCHWDSNRRLCKHCLYVLLKILGVGNWSIALDGLTVLRNQELGEVPKNIAVFLHTGAELLEQRVGGLSLQAFVLLGGSLSLQIFEDGVGRSAVHINLLHDLEGHTIVQLAEFLNLCVATWILLLELVAGESDNDESLILILLVQFLQSCELRGESTLAGCVHNQQYLTLKL